MTPAEIHRANRDQHLAAVRAENVGRIHVTRRPVDAIEAWIIAAVGAGGRP